MTNSWFNWCPICRCYIC